MKPTGLCFLLVFTLGIPAFAAPKPLFQSKVVQSAPVEIKVDLAGAKELFLVVGDGGDGIEADWADWMEPVLVMKDGSRMKLTELKAKIAEMGWGNLGVNRNAGGGEMKVGGKPVAFGLGAHAPARIGYDLPADVVAFEAKGAVDNGGTDQGVGSTVSFAVYQEEPPRSLPRTAGLKERYGLATAEEGMQSFTAAPGLVASLFAAEPMVQNPTNIDIDPQGRVWAAECLNYRTYMATREEGDRVVILEDTDGDGRADKEKTFYQAKDLTNPLGICVLPQTKGTKVIVSAAPNVWLLSDDDGDDVAEKAQVLFKVGGEWNYDHQIHAFTFGMDGKFYFNSGNSITKLTWPDGTIVTDHAGNKVTNRGEPYRQGMVFRCDIDLKTGKASNVETLAHNFRNNYEVTLDSFGTMWQSDNDDDGNKGVRINYVMEWGNYGFTDERTGAGWGAQRTNREKEIPQRHWYQNDPGVVPNLMITGQGSPTGITVNEGPGLGNEFSNEIIHCDAGPRVTRAYPVKEQGAGYTAGIVNVLTGTDSWYRPSDLSVAPDGALFVADWYDPGVGGHAMGDHEKDRIMGRVYRVAMPDLVKARVPDFRTADGAAMALTSPNRATQYQAWTSLHAMGAKADSALAALFNGTDPRLAARALGLLSQIDGAEIKWLGAGLRHSNENVRIAAIRLCATLALTRGLDTTPLEEDQELVGKLFNDTPAVRRQLALTLHGASGVEEAWAKLAARHEGKDRWYLEALGIGATGKDDACFDAWLALVGDQWNTPGGRDIIWRLRATKTAIYLTKILEDPATPTEGRLRYMRSFDFLPDSEAKSAALLEIATSGKAPDEVIGEALARLKGRRDPAVEKAVASALKKAQGTAAFVALVREFGAQGQGEVLMETALALGSDPAAGDAIRILLKEPDANALIRRALDGGKPEAVLNLLASSGSQKGLESVLMVVSSAATPSLGESAVRAAAMTPAGAKGLVAMAKEGKFPEKLKPAAGAALRAVQYPDLANDITSLFPMLNRREGASLAPVSELVALSGDAAKGRALFVRTESTCISCHQAGGAGVSVGPALSEIGSKLPKEAIYEAILKPNSGLSMGFETQLFTLRAGGAAAGIVSSETNDEIVLVLPGGATQKLAKNQIMKREKLATSLMPAGLQELFSQTELVDLVEYLSSLQKK